MGWQCIAIIVLTHIAVLCGSGPRVLGQGALGTQAARSTAIRGHVDGTGGQARDDPTAKEIDAARKVHFHPGAPGKRMIDRMRLRVCVCVRWQTLQPCCCLCRCIGHQRGAVLPPAGGEHGRAHADCVHADCGTGAFPTSKEKHEGKPDVSPALAVALPTRHASSSVTSTARRREDCTSRSMISVTCPRFSRRGPRKTCAPSCSPTAYVVHCPLPLVLRGNAIDVVSFYM